MSLRLTSCLKLAWATQDTCQQSQVFLFSVVFKYSPPPPKDRVSCSLEWPRTLYVAKAGLEFTEILPASYLQSARIKKGVHHDACFNFFFFLNFLLFGGAEDKIRVLGMLASCALNLHFQPVCKASLL